MIPNNKVNYIIKKIETTCQECEGQGCSVCRAKIARVSMYDRANIPIEYWDKSWKEFSGDKKFKELIANNILTKINDVYDSGKSYAFVGSLGTGKSYASCAILKLALVNNFSAYYCNMSDIIDQLTKSENDIVSRMMNSDFVVIDEFDIRWVYPSEEAEQLFGQTLERILRNRFQNNMPTFICSNTLDIKTVLGSKFSKSIDSLFSKFIETVFVSGKDFRKKDLK